jgi:leucyl aminopeptidase
MKITLHTSGFEQVSSPVLMLPVFSDQRNFPDSLQFLTLKMVPAVEQIFNHPGFERKLNQKRVIFTAHPHFPAVALVGAGERKNWNLETARELWGGFITIANELKENEFAIYWGSEFTITGKVKVFFQEMVAAMYTADYRLREFYTDQSVLPPPVEQVQLMIPGTKKTIPPKLELGQHLGDSINLARRLAEYPSNRMNPSIFSQQVEDLGKRLNWELEILQEQDLKKKGLGALLAVGQGSHQPPNLTIARYFHPAAVKKIALVGKGVTFDTGGISIKPSKKMEEMKYDMSGAAVVLATIQMASLARLPLEIIAVMPLVENMPSGKASRPGDIVQSYSGKTIEIIDTDAEGRLILADALSYVEQNYQPDYIVDLATLTGAVVSALGNNAAAILTRDPFLQKTLEQASELSGEKIWPLPLWEEYQELMKSSLADIRNLSTKTGAGVITAAIFLQKFVQKTPWAHLDIAGTAYEMPEKTYRPPGATGFGVKLLWHWLNILLEEPNKKKRD